MNNCKYVNMKKNEKKKNFFFIIITIFAHAIIHKFLWINIYFYQTMISIDVIGWLILLLLKCSMFYIILNF